jgi:large subunit ribosomal protein L21
MFAVIRSGGKQYRVVKDDRIVVERIAGEPGTMIQLADVLMLGGDGKAPTLGRPAVAKAAVFAEVLEHSRADKIIVFKKKRRNNYRRKAGHRQHQTVLRIVDVSPTGAAPKFTPTPKREPKPVVKKAKKEKTKAAPAEVEEKKPAVKAEDKASKKAPAKAKAEPAKKPAKARASKKAPAKAKATSKKKSARDSKKGKDKS